MNIEVYILTREINAYDQDGAYFVNVFSSLPTYEMLIENGVPKNRIRHVLNGGGRVDYEYEWFYLQLHVC